VAGHHALQAAVAHTRLQHQLVDLHAGGGGQWWGGGAEGAERGGDQKGQISRLWAHQCAMFTGSHL
jgi:hypothetical protein